MHFAASLLNIFGGINLKIKIGNVELENNVFLAPMAGVTDRAFREICKDFGCGLVYTEMISAKGLFYKDKKTAGLMKIEQNEQPAAIQIFGSDPLVMGDIAKAAAESGAILLDINMGCPAPKIVNNGDGSALMKNPPLAGKIIETIVNAVDIPVTVKFRKGWDDEHINAIEFAKIAQESGASAVTIHGRTRMQFYSGNADWDIIKKIKTELSIPVIGNGDIFSAEAAKNMLEETGCDGIMVARGCEGNPFIFRQINEILSFGNIKFYPNKKERIECALRHAALLEKYKGPERGIKESRKHMAWYIKGMPNSGIIKEKLFKASTLYQIQEILEKYLSE